MYYTLYCICQKVKHVNISNILCLNNLQFYTHVELQGNTCSFMFKPTWLSLESKHCRKDTINNEGLQDNTAVSKSIFSKSSAKTAATSSRDGRTKSRQRLYMYRMALILRGSLFSRIANVEAFVKMTFLRLRPSKGIITRAPRNRA